jgi:hypothetical protein
MDMCAIKVFNQSINQIKMKALNAHPRNMERADGVGGKLRHIHQLYVHQPVRLSTTRGPVLIAFDLKNKQTNTINSSFKFSVDTSKGTTKSKHCCIFSTDGQY